MLVLKRNIEEKIYIGEDIVIMVTAAGDGWCKLGITAPKEVKILRDDTKQTEPKETP
jgi:carbon storage regulator CsrA